MPRETFQERLAQLEEKQEALGQLVEGTFDQATSALATGTLAPSMRIRPLDRQMRTWRADIERFLSEPDRHPATNGDRPAGDFCRDGYL